MEIEEKHAVVRTVTLSIGNGYYGRLGHGDWMSRPYFAVIEWFLKQNISICKVACTAGSTIALSDEGYVYCCGKNHLGQLGVGTCWDEESFPKKIQFDNIGNLFDSVENIWAGESQVFAKKKDGSCWCWGAGYFGVLGLGGVAEEQQTSPVKLPQEFVEFASGSMHSIARDASGDVWTTGKNVEGQLGYDLEAGRKSNSRFRMVEFFKIRGIKAKQIGCGKYNSAMIDEDGRFWIWGKASEGSLGQPTEIDILRHPTQVVLDEKVVKMAFGMHHYLLLTDKSEVFGFGLNSFSQLALAEPKAKVHQPTKIDRLMEILMQDQEEISQIGCSYDTSFVISRKGRLYTWGHNWYGKNGVGKNDLDDLDVEFPTLVSSLKDLRVIDCTGGNESLLVVAEFDGSTAKLPRVDSQRDGKIKQSRWEYPIQNKYHPTEQELTEMDRIRFPEKYPIPAAIPPPPPPPAPASIKRN